MRTAFASLPAAMRQILGLTEVDQLSRREVAQRLNAAPDAVAVRAMRARRALGSAYLEQHRASSDDHDHARRACRDTRANLVGYLRGTVGRGRRARVEAHLETCAECVVEHAELERINEHLRSTAGPALLIWLRALTASARDTFAGLLAAAPASAAAIVAAASMGIAVPPPTATQLTSPSLRSAVARPPASLEVAPEAPSDKGVGADVTSTTTPDAPRTSADSPIPDRPVVPSSPRERMTPFVEGLPIVSAQDIATRDPVHHPTDPVHHPTDPVHRPTDPVHHLTDPVHHLTDPVRRPTDPVHRRRIGHTIQRRRIGHAPPRLPERGRRRRSSQRQWRRRQR